MTELTLNYVVVQKYANADNGSSNYGQYQQFENQQNSKWMRQDAFEDHLELHDSPAIRQLNKIT